MSIITTKSGKKIYKKAESLCLVPYVYNSTLDIYELGNDIYDLSSIIGDSITIENSDGEVVTKKNEYSGNNIVVNTTMGDTKVTAQCLDLQNAVLRSLFGASVGRTGNPLREIAGLAAMPDDYLYLTALVRIRFSDSRTPDIYLPQVEINSQLLIQQMKTRGGQGTLSGVVKPKKVCVGVGSTSTSLVSFLKNDGTSSYMVDTPVLFCPGDRQPLFFRYYNEGNQTYYFSMVDFANGTNTKTYYVDINNPDHYNSY